MNKIVHVFAILLLTYVLGNAQNSGYKLNMKMVITSPDTQMVTLNHSDEMDEIIEGYYFVPRYKMMFLVRTAALQPGGFSFLSSNVFGGIADYVGEKWVKNKFPMEDIETMSNGMDIQKALSFQLKPLVIDVKSDTLSLLVKYAVYDFIQQKDFNLDYDYNVKLFYKLVHIPYEKNISFNFINKHFKNHNIMLKLSKKIEKEKLLLVEKETVIFDEIQKSAKESKLINQEFNFEIGLTRFDEAAINQFSAIAKYQEQNLPSVRTIANSKTNEKVEIPSNVYYGKLKFPSIIYNRQKSELYKNFNTKEKVLQSTCEVIIVPIKLVDDSLTFDLFIDYSKLSLNDGIPRWTPIKKRLTIDNDRGMTSITLPKENWSANFTRNNEDYDIYGYSDFERFVNEQLYIKYEVLNNRGK